MKPGSLQRWLIGIGAVVILVIGYFYFSRSAAAVQDVPVFTAQRGLLQINVLQGGEIRALENLEMKSEIEIPTKILSLIPEGYMVTEEDVRAGKVLVELDDSEIKQRIVDHEIQFQTTVASYIEADEQREIQRSENQTLFRETRQLAMFGLMDFEKYLGKQAATGVLKSAGLPETLDAFDLHVAAIEAAASTPVLKSEKDQTGGEKASAKSKPNTVKKDSGEPERVDFLAFLDGNKMADGEAQQKLRQLNDELLLHRAEEALAKQNFEASARLENRQFITKTALENDQVTLEKMRLAVKTADTSLDLFRKYEFPKQCETFLAAYREALHKIQRTVRENRSKMAQAESKFTTAKRRYEVELTKKEDLERQLKACVMRAVQPGLVAYGDLDVSSQYRYNEPIEEGATVRIRQTILTIPDMTQMGVRVNVHESQVKKVKVGQRALVRVDAEPGKLLEAKVAELALLPDSASTRYTPNVKVYPCTIHITGAQEWMKPGMNAKVDIIIDELADALYVPVQSIEVENDHHFIYVNTGANLERREVTTGLFNDEFIEVRTGLNPGDSVALSLPARITSEPQAAPAAAEPAPAKPEKKAKGKEIAGT